jgi:hypothetical protein
VSAAATVEFDPTHELQTIPEHAARVKCSKVAVYKRIKRGKMPAGSVVYLPSGQMRIDWTVYARAVRLRPS